METIICKGCNKIYDLPWSLSCGDLLCKQCLSDNCKICNQKITCCILNKTVKSYIDSLIVKDCNSHTNATTSEIKEGNNNNITIIEKKPPASYCLECESFNNLDQLTLIHTYH